MSAVATIVSYRLGGSDGVSVEAEKWRWALRELGFDVRRVAGAIADPADDDTVLDGLAFDATRVPAPAELSAAIDGSDLVVAENICSLPLAEHVSLAVARALGDASRAGTRIVFRHHDLPWQRRALAHLDGPFPPRLDGALHVTINVRSMRELASRGIPAQAMHNRFDTDAPPGEREATRAAHGFQDDELVFLQPTRAIERKNVPGAVRYLQRLNELMAERSLRYWLTGPAEFGYEPTLTRVLEHSSVPVTLGRTARPEDAYAACDVVLFPSTWEGFGNPTVESVIARRPLVAAGYPVLSEISAYGIRFFGTDYPEDLVRYLARGDARLLELNLFRAAQRFALSGLPGALEATFASHGWVSW